MKIAHFSAGASSAVAAMLSAPDRLVYAETGSEHEDNERFIADFERVTGLAVTRFRSEKYRDTWDVWERERYLSNRWGAPCSKHLKLAVLAPLERIPGAVHVFGYTADEKHRARRLERLKPDLRCEFPLIDAGLMSAGCRQLLLDRGIRPPVTYEMGLPHANCIPRPKASSPRYWALIRECFPERFERMARLEESLRMTVDGQPRVPARLVRVKGERVTLRELPLDVTPSAAEAPSCDMLCEIAREAL